MIWKNWMNLHYLEKKNFIEFSIERYCRFRLQHAKIICKDFKIKSLVEYHDFYLKKGILLADVLENFRKIHELELAKFISAPGYCGKKPILLK